MRYGIRYGIRSGIRPEIKVTGWIQYHVSVFVFVLSLDKMAFSVIVPRLWNCFPPDIRNSLSLSTFRSKLKIHLFKLAFPLEFSPILSSDYPDLILVFPLHLALSNDKNCVPVSVLDTGHSGAKLGGANRPGRQ